MHYYNSLRTYKTCRPRKAVWSFVLSLPQLLVVPFNRLGSLRTDMTFPLSLPHAPLVMAAGMH